MEKQAGDESRPLGDLRVREARADRASRDARRRAHGGNLRGINGGAFFFLRLPGSRIEIDVPLIGQFPLVDRPDRGLVPDVTIVPTLADIAAGDDVVLRRTLRSADRRH